MELGGLAGSGALLASQFSEQMSLTGGQGAPGMNSDAGLPRPGHGDLMLSSAEATTAYSSSESSSADHVALDSGLLDSFGQLASRQSDNGVRSSGASAQEGGKSQICFDFTKGVCSRGDKCKYSHDLATIVHFNSKEKGICFDYLRNQCHRGLLCRFSHDLSNIAQQCQVYNNGPKDNKGTKPNAICYDFVKGVCQRGVECRYSHDLSLIARMARGGNAQPKAGEVCYDYLRGRCNRGATCKYSHNIAFLAAPGFLGSAMSSDGAPVAAQAPMPGAPSQLGTMMSGPMAAPPPGYMGINGMPPMGPRLASALSADHATLSMLAAAGQNAAAAHMLAASAAAMGHTSSDGSEGRRRSGSMNGDMSNDTLAVNDQPSAGWGGMPAQAKLAAMQHAAMLSNLAAQQRLAQATAAANLQQAYGAMPPHMGHMGMHGQHDGMMGGGMPPMMHKPYTTSEPGTGMGRPPLPPHNQLPPELAALLSGGVPDNQGLLAETFAAAAAAKVQAQQQNARMMAAANLAAGGNMMPSMSSLSAGGAMSSAAPQTIPGRESAPGNGSYDMGSNGGAMPSNGGHPGSNSSGGGAAGENNLSRSAPTSGPVRMPSNVGTELLPMIREIWAQKA